MRLGHMGFKAWMVGDSTVPHIGVGDLLIVAGGSGNTQTVYDIALKAHQNGADIALITNNPNSRIGALCTTIVKMASSYKFCVIATGEYDIYAASERANEWDYAAGHAIAQNAGAIIKTLEEKPFLYGKEDYKNPSLLIRRSENLND